MINGREGSGVVDGGLVERAWSSGGQDGLRRLLVRHGGPVVEETEDPTVSAVTFVFAAPADTDRVALVCAALPDRHALLARLGDGPLFAGTFLLPSSLRVEYCFLPDPPDRLEDVDVLVPATYEAGLQDPCNPVDETISYPELRFQFTDSVLALPAARPQPWVDERPGLDPGAVDVITARSARLGNERRVWVHHPRGIDPGAEVPAVVVLDGGHPWWRLQATFDNLQADGVTPPFLGVAVSSLGFVSRQRELAGNDDFVWFLVDELLPLLGQRHPLRRDGHVVAGASVGALGAAFVSLREPAVFSRFLSISGTLHVSRSSSPFPSKEAASAPRWITEEYERAAGPFPARAYLSAGNFERFGGLDYQRDSRALADVLRSKNVDVFFDTADTAHDTASFRGYLGDGLAWALNE